MKTTLELPDGLMQRVRFRAVHRNRMLKDAIAQLLELGMAAPRLMLENHRVGHANEDQAGDRRCQASKRGADLDEFDLGRTWLGASASAHRA